MTTFQDKSHVAMKDPLKDPHIMRLVMAHLGKARSEAKAKAARENGKLGGRKAK